MAPSLALLLIGSLFYGECGKREKYRWLPLWLPCLLAICFMENVKNVKNIGWLPQCRPCSLAICFMGDVENVKNVGGSLGGSLAHWFSVLWEMWKM